MCVVQGDPVWWRARASAVNLLSSSDLQPDPLSSTFFYALPQSQTRIRPYTITKTRQTQRDSSKHRGYGYSTHIRHCVREPTSTVRSKTRVYGRAATYSCSVLFARLRRGTGACREHKVLTSPCGACLLAAAVQYIAFQHRADGCAHSALTSTRSGPDVRPVAASRHRNVWVVFGHPPQLRTLLPKLLCQSRIFGSPRFLQLLRAPCGIRHRNAHACPDVGLEVLSRHTTAVRQA